ncbi:type VII secretion-associated protein [Corynebacterium pacaense]|uniref:type VII secretion-associated protein n=1 Tax=Corynebacterium pacaense TaxID=1816684 RepID=UPI0009BB78ED|nr:type VII secretion-associated protein [Corynebacterium pacaense]
MRIAIDETVSIFQGSRGADSVHRYDLPAEGIVEGWAIPAMVEQTRDLAESWPEVEVDVAGDGPAAEILIRTLAAQGVTARREEVEPVAAGEPVPVRRPTHGRRGTRHRGISALRLVLSLGLVCGIALTWFLVGGMNGRSPAPVVPLVPATQAAGPGPVAVSSAAEASTSPVAPASVVLIDGDIQIEAPFGSELRAGIVTGIDADLRVHLALDPVVGDERRTRDALQAMIDEDPTLELATGAGVRGVLAPISYVERPGDGSIVTWTTWFDAGRRVSVGCHSRREPHPSHDSACAGIAESLTVIEGSGGEFPGIREP